MIGEIKIKHLAMSIFICAVVFVAGTSSWATAEGFLSDKEKAQDNACYEWAKTVKDGADALEQGAPPKNVKRIIMGLGFAYGFNYQYALNLVFNRPELSSDEKAFYIHQYFRARLGVGLGEEI